MIMLVVMVVTQVTQHKIYAFVRKKKGIVPIQHVTEPLHNQFHAVRKKFFFHYLHDFKISYYMYMKTSKGKNYHYSFVNVYTVYSVGTVKLFTHFEKQG